MHSDSDDTELSIIDRDTTGRTAYIRACDKLGIVPVSYFLRHIEEQEVTMKHHGLGIPGTKAIAKVLKDNIRIEKLDLSGNWMEPTGAMYMAKLLHENDYISDLVLSDNQFCDEGAYHISKMLLVNNTLQNLDLSGNKFGDKGATYIAEAIEKNKYVRVLSLSSNDMGDSGGVALGPAISANDSLRELDLSWNQLRKRGAMAVAKGIKENIGIKVCNLSWNGLGPAGGVAIGDVIASNQSLIELDVSGNRLDVTSADVIAKALKKNEDLLTLKMGNNPITTTGAILLAKGLNDHDGSALTTLDLTDIPVEYEFLRIIEDIQLKRKLRVLHGPVLRSGNTAADIGKPGVDIHPRIKDPLLVLQEHIVVNDLRIINILKSFDTDNTLSVTPQQFAQALEQLGVPYTTVQLQDMSRRLDQDDTGRVHYGGFLQRLPAEEPTT